MELNKKMFCDVPDRSGYSFLHLLRLTRTKIHGLVLRKKKIGINSSLITTAFMLNSLIGKNSPEQEINSPPTTTSRESQRERKRVLFEGGKKELVLLLGNKIHVLKVCKNTLFTLLCVVAHLQLFITEFRAGTAQSQSRTRMIYSFHQGATGGYIFQKKKERREQIVGYVRYRNLATGKHDAQQQRR